MPRRFLPTTLGPRRLAALIATCIALLAPGSARAGLLVTAQDVTYDPGATSAFLDVTLENTGPGSVDIGGFAFQLKVGIVSTDITFTGVTTATAAPYIFDGLGFFDTDIAVPGFTGQDIMASDFLLVSGSGITLGEGATVGLGRLVFDVSGSASGVYEIELMATSLSNPGGTDDVPITSLVDGSVTVQSVMQPVPEPATMVSAGLAALLLAGYGWRRRSRAAA